MKWISQGPIGLLRTSLSSALPRFLLAGSAFTFLGCQGDGSVFAPSEQPLDAISTANAGRTTERSLQEWLAAQGTFCEECSLVFPLPDLIGNFGRDGATFGWFDYTGVADAWLLEMSNGAIDLGTTVDGRVTERLLNDGRVEIDVRVTARNALAFAGAADYLPGDPVHFGATAPQVLAGATPALGTVTMQFTFILAAPGLPLPDLVQVAFFPEPGEEILKIVYHARATGVLHAPSGFAEGTAGTLSVQQVGIFHTRSPRKANNPFAAESVVLRPTGGP